MDHPGGDQVQLEGLAADRYGMPGVIPSVKTSNDVGLADNQSTMRPLPFVPPLGAYQNGEWQYEPGN